MCSQSERKSEAGHPHRNSPVPSPSPGLPVLPEGRVRRGPREEVVVSFPGVPGEFNLLRNEVVRGS
jgi:hypothetical protein